MIAIVTEAMPAFLLALFCGYLALAFAHAPPVVSRWGVSRELWPKLYNAIVLQAIALLLAAYAGISA